VIGIQAEAERIDDDCAMVPRTQRQVRAGENLRLESELLQLAQRVLANLGTLGDRDHHATGTVHLCAIILYTRAGNKFPLTI
jgi:hypothetical protein